MTRARIVRGQAAADAEPLPVPTRQRLARRVSAVEQAARRRAREIIDAAQAEAHRRIAAERLSVIEEARATALGEVAVALARARERERRADEAAESRVVALATLLAERLLGEELRTDPARIGALAKTAIDEARGARAVVIRAHPGDAELLASTLPAGDAPSVEVRPDPALSRGDLVLETDVGLLRAHVGARLENLARRLGEALEQ